VTQRFLIKSFLFLTSLLPLQKINLMLQLRRKVEKYDQAKRYFEMLLSFDEKELKGGIVDFHLYKQALYIEFN